jgi:hypothetical protein
VRVAMQKVDGVETVRVSLKEGLTILELKPHNSVTLSQLRTVIRNNGFVSKEAQIVAFGATKSAPAGNVFEVSGTGEQLSLAAKAIADSLGRWRFTSPSPAR